MSRLPSQPNHGNAEYQQVRHFIPPQPRHRFNVDERFNNRNSQSRGRPRLPNPSSFEMHSHNTGNDFSLNLHDHSENILSHLTNTDLPDVPHLTHLESPRFPFNHSENYRVTLPSHVQNAMHTGNQGYLSSHVTNSGMPPPHNFGNQRLPPPHMSGNQRLPPPHFVDNQRLPPHHLDDRTLPPPHHIDNQRLPTPYHPANPRQPPPHNIGNHTRLPPPHYSDNQRLPPPHNLENQRLPPLNNLQNTGLTQTIQLQMHNKTMPEQVFFQGDGQRQRIVQKSGDSMHTDGNTSKDQINIIQGDNIALQDKDSEDENVKIDQMWIKKWLWLQNQCVKTQDADKGKSSSIKITEAKSLLKDMCVMVKELQTLMGLIKDKTAEESERAEKIKKAKEIKLNLESIKEVLSSDKVQASLKQKIIIRRKTRERKKLSRKRKYEELIEKEESRQEEHIIIDKWQEEIYNKVQESKRENELKTIADKTLAEVRRKTNDVKKGLESLQSLSKLRSVRKDSMERKGLYTPKDSDTMFQARLRMQEEILQKQLRTYEAENRLIQVMLDTEQQECQEYEEEEFKRNKEEKEKQHKLKVREILFGEESLKGTPPPTSDLYRFYVYHDAANYSVDNLIAIRHEWDAFLVRENSTEGSRLPPTWVTPSEPASEVWASALKS